MKQKQVTDALIAKTAAAFAVKHVEIDSYGDKHEFDSLQAATRATQPDNSQEARYVVVGYGESDYPISSFANNADELLDAVLGMIYTTPSDANDDTREEYRRDLADENEWCAKVWRTEFEIGGIVVYDTGERAALSAHAGTRDAPSADAVDAQRYRWLQQQRARVWHQIAEMPIIRTSEFIDANIAAEGRWT